MNSVKQVTLLNQVNSAKQVTLQKQVNSVKQLHLQKHPILLNHCILHFQTNFTQSQSFEPTRDFNSTDTFTPDLII